jgi:dethiobiotin synthetase
MNGRSCFVTGTDTGVGKTLVARALIHLHAASGLRAGGMKPVASGAFLHEGVWCNEDVQALQAASNAALPTQLVNPYLLRQATAPHIAAAEEGVHRWNTCCNAMRSCNRPAMSWWWKVRRLHGAAQCRAQQR